MPKDAFLTPPQAMKIMKLKPFTFYRLLQTGQIPGAVKFGRQWRIDSEIFWARIRGKETPAHE